MIDEIYDLFLRDSAYTPEEYEARVSRGLALASKIKNLYPFLQPILLPAEKSKSAWEPCARVLASRTDAELLPYLYPLFSWLQDMNWPGADIICERLLLIPFPELSDTFSLCTVMAERTADNVWLEVLADFKEQAQP